MGNHLPSSLLSGVRPPSSLLHHQGGARNRSGADHRSLYCGAPNRQNQKRIQRNRLIAQAFPRRSSRMRSPRWEPRARDPVVGAVRKVGGAELSFVELFVVACVHAGAGWTIVRGSGIGADAFPPASAAPRSRTRAEIRSCRGGSLVPHTAVLGGAVPAIRIGGACPQGSWRPGRAPIRRQSPILSLTATAISCSAPRYRSVVWIEECPSRNLICSISPSAFLQS